MSFEAHLSKLVEDAVRRALADVQPGKGSKLTPIKGAKVAYRMILDAEKVHELRIYRKGHASFVDEDELDAWIKATGANAATTPVVETDEVGELIALNHRRRRGSRTG
jgi:hypothetical protein